MKNMKNENAVSPVIGVILMVVITVIIAAILAVFAFGMGAPNKAPQTQLKFIATASPANFSVTNTGGDSLILKDEQITVTNAANGNIVLTATLMNSWATGAPQYLAPGKIISGGYTTTPAVGDIIIVQVLDVPTGQLISSAKVTVQ
jgi:flagellin-like protein